MICVVRRIPVCSINLRAFPAYCSGLSEVSLMVVIIAERPGLSGGLKPPARLSAAGLQARS
jgi:hypothetical protein